MAPPAPAGAGQTGGNKPSIEQVRRRAYEIYLQRVSSGKPGDAASDWTQAERELRR